jgi:hypothetical protein
VRGARLQGREYAKEAEPMKIFGIIGTTLLLLLLGTGVTVYAQDQRDDAKPQAQEEEKPKQEEAKPAKPEEDKNVKQEEKRDENERKQEEKTSRQDESKTVQSDHHMEAAQDHDARGGRIPDDKFRAHFGREHTFRVGHPTIVEGRPRFQYGGYAFVMVDPWPVGWAYTDAVYIDFIDGVYYLINPVHPGVQIVVNVVM